MKLCHECYAILPDPSEKGHRRRKFCNAACKQRFYRKHRSERKQYQHTPFWKELSDDWQRMYHEEKEQNQQLRAELDRERKYGDVLEEALSRIREKQEWLEARVSAVEGMLHIEPISPEGERFLQEVGKALGVEVRHMIQQINAELDVLK